MKAIENAMHDLKASIAAEIASVNKRGERAHVVAKTLQIEEDEARYLISRGRRLAREKAKERAA
ncbi:hypothetical protein JQ600_35610 [Bradyrhizobium sp. AUGA SZCCT0176]|uniref:hypothetical protein n=1 Tax=Bradyrhizobium sp. AUGA SZCCT0176 TaxID=2807664 RepID=UPI001BAA2B71|nr:hypothetical protein [Bradyrhizobium sp. AUGA SZCCT0176]MBR1230225.1 hypothetical protein [Bradyrhizobium sp. AUGA SZCCT0176]